MIGNKMHRFTRLFFQCLFLFEGRVWSLRNLTISVPRAAFSGEGQSVVLRCTFDLEGAALYSSRWYRIQYEFYRYVPRELPPTMVFPITGASVDLEQSDHQQVRLVNLDRRLSGIYQCEVSADLPLFHTAISSAPLTIVDPPFHAPRVSVSRFSYTAGDVIRANCSVSESYPAANITWIIDSHKIGETISPFSWDEDFTERGAFSEIVISILEDDSHKVVTYDNSDLHKPYQKFGVYDKDIDKESQEIIRYTTIRPASGHFSLSCVATIFDIYARESEPVHLREDDPHPASVTRDDSAGVTIGYNLGLVYTGVLAAAGYRLL